MSWSKPYYGVTHLRFNGWTATVEDHRTYATAFIYHRSTPNKLTDNSLLTEHESVDAAKTFAETKLLGIP